MLGCNMEGVDIIGNYSLNQCGIRYMLVVQATIKGPYKKITVLHIL